MMPSNGVKTETISMTVSILKLDPLYSDPSHLSVYKSSRSRLPLFAARLASRRRAAPHAQVACKIPVSRSYSALLTHSELYSEEYVGPHVQADAHRAHPEQFFSVPSSVGTIHCRISPLRTPFRPWHGVLVQVLYSRTE